MQPVQILETIRFIIFRADSFTRGQPLIIVTGHWRILSYVLRRAFYAAVLTKDLAHIHIFQLINTLIIKHLVRKYIKRKAAADR